MLPLLLLLFPSFFFQAICGSSSSSSSSTTIYLDTTAVGPSFDGVGGCSAGTGPRLLVDYPSDVRSAILDFLFLPNYGASLSILKVEIGGTGDSTTGTESSHEPIEGQYEWEAGYQWFMIQEAKKRNPLIQIYGLAWTFPGWIANSNKNDFGELAAQYLADWAEGARNKYNITVDWMGFHNESPWENAWVIALRNELDKRDLEHIRIVVGDCGPGPSYQTPDMLERLQDPALAKAAAVVGYHYPLSILPVNENQTLYDGLWNLSQSLWASEDYSTYSDKNGGRCLAKLVSRNYVDANITATIVWDMIWAWYDGLACAGDGLIWAGEPWSGHFGVVDPIWSVAHTTQFVTPGQWAYLKKGALLSSGVEGGSGSGYLPSSSVSGKLGGTYVGLVGSNEKAGEFTLIIETMDNSVSECSYGNEAWKNVVVNSVNNITFCLVSHTGSCPPLLALWQTDTQQEIFFDHVSNIILNASCCFDTSLNPNSIYTLTTTKGQGKGTFPGMNLSLPVENLSRGCGVPAKPIVASPSPFPMPYFTDFSSPAHVKFNDFPEFLSDIQGVFRVGSSPLSSSASSSSSSVLWQTVGASHYVSQHAQRPASVLGSKMWTDYRVNTTACFVSSATSDDFLAMYARVGHGYAFSNAGGYGLFLRADGQWSLNVSLSSDVSSSLASGRVAVKTEPCYLLELLVDSSTIHASVDGTQIGIAKDGNWTNGLVGLGCGWHSAYFTSFSVAPLEKV